MNSDDAVLTAIRHSIGRRFGHVLSPHSPTEPPDLPTSVIPLLDIDGKAEAAARRGGSRRLTSSDERKHVAPPREALASPQPPSRTYGASQTHHKALSTNRVLSYDNEPLKKASGAGALSRSLEADHPPPPVAAQVHINRRGQIQIFSSPTKPSAISESKIKTNTFSKDFISSDPPILGYRSHQPTAAAISSDELLEDLFTSKLIPAHTPGSPVSHSSRSPSHKASSSAGLTPEAAAIRSSGFESLIRKRCAYMGHRHEMERYASLLALRDMLVEQKKTHPNTPLPLPHEVLGSVAVMLDQAPLRAPHSNDHSPRCHAAGLQIVQLYGSQGEQMVPRLSSLLQRLWTRRARVANSVAQGGDLPWSVVEPAWIIDAMVATGLSGIIELLRMCSDGYGAKDSEILTGIVQHPAVQQAVVAPALADELGHPDTGRSSQALRGLILLGKLSKGTTAELHAMLDISSVKPELVCAALSSSSTGEQILIQALDSTSRSEVRAAAAAALAYNYLSVSLSRINLAILVITRHLSGMGQKQVHL
eukprot:g3268.t1